MWIVSRLRLGSFCSWTIARSDWRPLQWKLIACKLFLLVKYDIMFIFQKVVECAAAVEVKREPLLDECFLQFGTDLTVCEE